MVIDGKGRPHTMCLTAGNISDYTGAEMMLDDLPSAKVLLADRGYDSSHFRKELLNRGITPCIPPRCNRKVQYKYDKLIYKQRNVVERAFSKLKDWRRISTRYDRSATIFFSAICLAATIIWWI